MADLFREYVAALAVELARVGVDDYQVRSVGRLGHPRLFYTYKDREQFVVLPASPSDSRAGIRNAVGFLRRQLGIAAPTVAKSARPAKRRAGERDITIAGCLDARPDPLAVLAQWRPAPPPSRWAWRRVGPRQWAVEVAHG